MVQKSSFFSFLIIGILLGLSGCSQRYLSPPLLAQCSIKGPLESSVKAKYGAYYAQKSTFLQLGFHPKDVYQIEAGELHIIAQKGEQFTTIPIANRSMTLNSWQIEVTDSIGVPLPYNEKRVIDELETSGALVFGTLPLGAIIRYELLFTSSYSLSSFEERLQTTLPIENYTFIIGSSKSIPSITLTPQEIALLYAPTISIDSLYYEDTYYTHTTFLPLVERAQPLYLRGSLVSPQQQKEKISKVAQKMYRTNFTYNDLTESQKRMIDSMDVSEIYCWVRDSISLIPTLYRTINLSNVLETAQANVWEKATLLSAFLTFKGYDTDIILTRRISEGGFDSSLILEQMCIDPLVVVGDSLTLFPYEGSFPAGVYPLDYWGNQGLAVENATIRPLPQSSVTSSKMVTHSTLEFSNLQKSPLVAHVEMKITGYHGFVLKNRVSSLAHTEQQRLIEQIFRQRDEGNQGDVQRVVPLKNGLTCTLLLANESAIKRRDTKTLIRIGYLFEDFFPNFNADAQLPYHSTLAQESVETLTLVAKDITFDQIAVDTITLDNALFSYSVSIVDMGSTLEIMRIMKIKKGDIAPLGFAKIARDLAIVHQKDRWFIRTSKS